MCYTLSRRRRARGDSGGGELHLIEVSEVVRQPERPHKQRLDRVRLLALVVDGVLEAVAVLPYYRLAPPDFFGRNASQDVERLVKGPECAQCLSTPSGGLSGLIFGTRTRRRIDSKYYPATMALWAPSKPLYRLALFAC